MIKMNLEDSDLLVLTRLALLYGIMFILIGILGIISLFLIQEMPIAIDLIEQMVLILIGIIFLRGYGELKGEKQSGEAFMFVGTIVGIILGTIGLLEFLLIGLVGGLLNEYSPQGFLDRLFSYLLNPALILGFLTLIPHKMIKYREI
jgi:membrane protease YdiL (CAAX protease family)